MRFPIRPAVLRRSAWALALIVLAVPASAAATTRYVSATGAGAACSQSTPCSLVTASNQLVAGDELIIGPGSYTVASTLNPGEASGTQIHGAPGAERPVISVTTAASQPGIRLGAGAVLSHLEFRGAGGSTGVSLNGEGIEVHDSIITAAGTTDAIRVSSSGNGAVIRDSVVSASGWAIYSNAPTLALRNVTAASTTYALRVERAVPAATVDVVNSILSGPVRLGSTPGDTSITIDYSAYLPATQTGVGFTPGTHNLTTLAPAFVNAAGGDYHQAAGSPTIDAGRDFVGISAFDFDGDPRKIGFAPDIGADEALLTPAVTTGDATEVTRTTAALAGYVNPNAGATTWQFEYGTTTSYGQTTPVQAFGALNSAQTVTATLASLTAGTGYHYRLVATNATGTTTGADRTFTTAPAPPPEDPPPTGGDPAGGQPAAPPADPSTGGAGLTPTPTPQPAADTVAPVLSGLRVSRATRVTFRLSEAGRVTFRLARRTSGGRYKRLRGKLTVTGVAGANVRRLKGRWQGRALRPGVYRLRGVAVDAAGNTARAVTVTFRRA